VAGILRACTGPGASLSFSQQPTTGPLMSSILSDYKNVLVSLKIIWMKCFIICSDVSKEHICSQRNYGRLTVTFSNYFPGNYVMVGGAISKM
jgi:hypothetical protein